jgi:methionyl-tRNA formyltransferase
LAELGARLIIETLTRLPLTACPQPETGLVYAAKIEKSEALLDWREPAGSLVRRVRAFNPFPGAISSFSGSPLKIWSAEVTLEKGEPGVVLAVDRNGIVVACGEGSLRLTELQKAGGKRLPAKQFLAGTPVLPGNRFELPKT